MPQVINTNISSLNAQRNLNGAQGTLQKSLQRLSTGLRINSAKDDAAGLAVSERMTAQIRGLNQAVRNANDGISLSQTAEGSLGTVSDSLLRIRELAIQSANATNSGSDRQALQAEVNQLLSEIQRVSTTTEFNGLKLFDGTFTSQTFQVGANANQTISISLGEVSTSSLGSYTYTASNLEDHQGTSSSTVAAATLANTAVANTVTAQTVTLGGSFGTQAINIGAGDTAKTIAATVNAQSSTTSITATAETVATLNSFDTGTVTLDLATDANGSFVSINAAVTATDASELATAINNASGQTGITAELTSDNSGVVLTNAEGNNILIKDYTNTAGAGSANVVTAGETEALDNTGATGDSVVIAGTVTFTSFEAFTVQSDDANTAGSIFDLAASTTAGSSQNQLSTVDISTQNGAQDAIDIVDAALDRVNSVRGDLGALQNRFESAINNMSNISENLSSARSRIRDADFAFETAELTKAQILQQAGIAILGQANALPQNALALLQ